LEPIVAMTRLSIIFPAYNEAERLPSTLETYLAQLPHTPGEVEVLVVDDGSTDATLMVAKAAADADPRVRVIRIWPNHGKGFAVRTAMLAAEGEIVVFTDADGSYGLGQLENVVRALAEAPVAIGMRPADAATGSLVRRTASRVFNRFMRSLLDLPYRDTQYGLKGFRRQAAQAIFSRSQLDGFAFDAEALMLARRLGLAVAEVPVQAQERDGSKVHVLLDARRMLGELWAIRRSAGTDHPDLSHLRVVDRARRAEELRAPDRNLVL
jgi:dolichyl-phosphate beta-glucosyltransferase